MSAVDAAIGGDLVGWKGLPEAFDEAALRATVPARWSSHPRAGARAGSSFTILRAPRAGTATDLEAWIMIGQSVITSLEYRPGPDPGKRRDPRGPRRAQTARIRHLAPPCAFVRDHVHAGRGITISVAQPHQLEPLRATRTSSSCSYTRPPRRRDT